MSKKHAQHDFDQLRCAAKAKLANEPQPNVPDLSFEALLHELQVNQIELEAQNESLRQAHIEMEESRDRYVDFYDFSPVGYLTLNQDGMIVEINLTGAELIREDRQKILKRRFSTYITTEYQDNWHRYFMSALKNTNGFRCELVLQRRDGSRIFTQLNGLRLKKDGKDPVVRIVLTDITERKQAEELLHESNDRLDFAFKGSGDGMWDWDVTTAMVRYSVLWKSMLGYDDGELANEFEEWEQRVHPDDLPKALADIKSYLHGETSVYNNEHRLLCKDGSYKWILTRGIVRSRAADGTPQRLIGTHTDISEQKKIEESLRISATAFETQEIIMVTDERAVIVRVNSAFTNLTGYSEEEVIGKLPFILQSGRYNAAFYQSLCEAIGRDHNWRGEIWGRRKDSTEFLAQLSISAVKDKGWITSHYVATWRDITAQNHAEEQLQLSFRKLEEKELAKTRFLAAAGHDLRQPLAAAQMFIYALNAGNPTTEQKDLIQKLMSSMSTFKDLLDALLNLSKLDSGRIKSKCEPINIPNLMIWLEAHFAPIAREKKLVINLYFSLAEIINISSDHGLLKSVLINLVANATKFTTSGAILLSARRRGKDVLFQVWDTGIGIAEENLQHIFEEFYQIDNPQRDRVSGLGLGLPIVKRTLDLLGSEIRCHSKLGRGSVFEFRLPILMTYDVTLLRNVMTVQNNQADYSFLLGKQFVLIEDDMLLKEATTAWIEAVGGHVAVFDSAESALEYANIEGADYYIVDHMLKGKLSGIDFLNMLYKRTCKSINAVLVTGNTSNELVRDADGFKWPVLFKPVNAYNLVSCLTEEVSR